MKAVFTKRARRQFETAVAWWRAHREAAPYLLEDEVQRAVRMLEEAPYSGAPGRDPRVKGVRRLVLRETQYLLYYRVLEAKQYVEVLRLWHAKRGKPLPR